MVVKVYISGISGNKEVKKRQQRVQLILDSKHIKYEVIDIAEPECEEQKDFMQSHSTSSGATLSDPTPRHPLPPQLFNDDVYCGDYDQFDMANEVDEMEKFLKLAADDTAPLVTSSAEIKLGNGQAATNVPDDEVTEKSNSLVEDRNITDDQKIENGKLGNEEAVETVEEEQEEEEDES